MKGEPSVQPYIPQVADEHKPEVGQEFQTIEGAYAFYNRYAREAGFSVRLSNSRKRPGTGELIWKKIVCYKEGETNETYQKKFKYAVARSGERTRGIVRVGCKAKLTLVKRNPPLWTVSKFVEEHNHELATPSKVHLLRSHSRLSSAKETSVRRSSDENVSTSKKARVTGIEHGADTERDIRNCKAELYEGELREEVMQIDGETLIELFVLEREKNHGFYFGFEKDKEDRLVRCFWVDPYSRRSYTFFGDVVAFDTVYNTNKYGMIFAQFTGFNHHGQVTMLGCGLLCDETTESFVWLFNQWMNAMSKVVPQMIVTDQVPAISKAVAQVLPKTFQRYGLWHILYQFSEKINPLISVENYHLLRNIILNSETIEEFERSWRGKIQKNKLEDNDWLCQLYEERGRWVPIYVKHMFAAEVSSSQATESCHSFLERRISKKHSLMDFIIRFNRALQQQRYEELMADHYDINEQPLLQSMWPIEKQMARVYTRKVFQSFQDEIFESSACIINNLCEDEVSVSYAVQTFEECSSKSQKLVYNKLSDFVSCSCQQFEYKGIPCRHMLTYFRIKQFLQLPTQYILQRWTKGAKNGPLWEKSGGEIKSFQSRSLMSRHAKLSQLFSTVIDDASLTEEGTNVLLNMLEDIQSRVKKINMGNGVEHVSTR
ncbi:protein FAR1-RELATED SEQUENCE 5-like [Ziziphus jujuba]|uniref:Protein FAR1-RELATED SEQUENCE n=1 Tax=Ziziphus jujuba TaxID=326968 RepID=A0A6P3ZJ13_ZIZJJ|nr:protein FAR1-RELATED SEQUENCE 5-like [Ziziphus jujuba]XP_024926105.2 protein FAR1-RELATED SEQUENCE 5-like [Ziziphus jujuba]